MQDELLLKPFYSSGKCLINVTSNHDSSPTIGHFMKENIKTISFSQNHNELKLPLETYVIANKMT